MGHTFRYLKKGFQISKVDKLCQPLSSDQELKNHIGILKFLSYILIQTLKLKNEYLIICQLFMASTMMYQRCCYMRTE